MSAATLPNLISNAQTTEEQFLRQIFVRDQMAEAGVKERREQNAVQVRHVPRHDAVAV